VGERKGWRVGSVRVEEREEEEAVIMLVLVMGLMALFSPIPCVDWSYSTSVHQGLQVEQPTVASGSFPLSCLGLF